MKKSIIIIIMSAIILAVSIIPTFAIEYNQNMTQFEDCLMYFRGTENAYQYAYQTIGGYYTTNGRRLFFTAPRLIIYQSGSAVKSYPYMSPEDIYRVYIDCDDNAQYWYLDVYDPSTDTYDRYGLLDTSCYMYKHQTLFPIIYTDNITTWGKDVGDYMSEGFDPWLAIRIPSTNAVLVPGNYYNSVLRNGYTQQEIQNIKDTEYNRGYEQGYDDFGRDAYARGKADGQTDIVQTEGVLRRFISAIFTAPSHFINTIFDFDIFGFNIASIVKTIFGILIIGVIVTIVIKLML